MLMSVCTWTCTFVRDIKFRYLSVLEFHRSSQRSRTTSPEIFRTDQSRCATQVWILSWTVGYILVPRANKTSRRRQHYYGTLPAIAHALLPYVFPAVRVYTCIHGCMRTHTQWWHIFAYMFAYAHTNEIQAPQTDAGLDSFYTLAISTIIESAPPSEAGPLIRNYSLVFPSHLSRNVSSLYVMPERYARNDTIIFDKEKFLSHAIYQAALEVRLSQVVLSSQWICNYENKISKIVGTTQF